MRHDAQPRLWLRTGHLWRDPPGRFDPGVVAVADGVIAAVHPADAVPPADEAWSALDLPDLYVLPGLINTHVHLEFSASPAPLREYTREAPEERLLRAIGNAHRLLLSGVTTARDCGSGWAMLALARRPDLSPVRLPRLLCAGPPITVPGGHLHVMGGEVGAEDMDAIHRHIARAADAGAGTVKVMASGGGMTPGTLPERATFSLDVLRRIAEEARRRALPSAAHVLATESIRRAALARFDSLEHCAFFERDAADDRLVRRYDPDVASVVADSGAFVMPNLSTATRSLDRMREAGNADEAGRHQLAQFDLMLENFGRLLALGIPMTCGTDAGVRDTPFEDTWRELDWMVRAGMPALEAIRSATTRAASVLGLDGKVGRIAAGHAADLIGVGGDSVADPAALRDVAFVLAAGHVVRGPLSCPD